MKYQQFLMPKYYEDPFFKFIYSTLRKMPDEDSPGITGCSRTFQNARI